MKKTIKATLISLVLALSVAIGVLFAGCAPGNEFKGEGVFMNVDLIYTLTLNNEQEGDKTFKFEITPKNGSEEGGTIEKLLGMFKRTGTYTEADDGVITLTFSAAVQDQNGGNITTVKSEGKNKIQFFFKGPDGLLEVIVTR